MNEPITRRRFGGQALLAALATGAASRGFASPGATSGAQMRFAVNEAASQTIPMGELFERYDPIAKLLGRATSTVVHTDPYIDISLFKAELARIPGPEFIFSKTVEILAKEVSAKRYQAMVTTNKPYVAGFIAASTFSGTSVESLKGQLVLFPPADTMTAQLGFAMLKAQGIPFFITDKNTPERMEHSVVIRHVKTHEIIASIIGNPGLSWYAAGLVNPSTLRSWKGRILKRLDPQPNWSFAARADLPASAVSAASEQLASLHETAAGAKVLAGLGVEKFVPAKTADYLRLSDYLS